MHADAGAKKLQAKAGVFWQWKLTNGSLKEGEKMRKRALSFILAVIMLTVVLPLSVNSTLVMAAEEPVEETGTPPAEESEAPAEESEAPAEESEAPAEESEAPAEESEAPAEESEAPAEESEAPAEESEAPAEESEAPAEESKAPAEESEAPAEESEAPAEESEAPAEENEAPAEESAPLKEAAAGIMSVNHFTGCASNGISVVADADEGVFPAGTTMQIVAVQKEEAIKAAGSAVDGEIVDAEAVNITFCDANGNEIQPANRALVHITLALSSEVGGEEHAVVHVGGSGAERIADASATGASFDAASFSIYAIIGQPGGKATITYEFYNDASSPALLATRIVKDGDTLVAPGTPVSTVDPSATFLGWSTNDDPAVYQTFGKITIPGTVTQDTTVKLYARFHKMFHVFFHNQYNAIIQSFGVERGSDFHVPDYNAYVTFPLPVDLALVGWSTILAPSGDMTGLGDEAGAVIDLIDIQADVNLYPVLDSVYWISYVSNGGSFTAPVFFRLGTSTTEPTPPTRAGYTFAGWYTDAALLNPYTFGPPLSADITLYAKWIPSNSIPYKVAYWTENADNTEYSLLQVDLLYGTVDTMTAASENPSGIVMDPNLWTLDGGTVVQKTISGDGSTLVHVYYNRTVKEIYFYTAASHGAGNPDVEIPELRITAKWGAGIRSLWPSTRYPGQYTSNWYISKTGGTAQASIDMMPVDGGAFWDADLQTGELYKIYHYLELPEGQTSSVTYDGKYFGVEPITDTFHSGGYTWWSTPEDYYPIAGYTYSGNVVYVNGHAAFDADHAITFYYLRNSYNINFFSSGNLVKQVSKQYEADISDENYIPDSSLAPVSGYEFKGWYNNDEFAGDPVTLSGEMPASDITFYAKWGPPEYDVHFDLNGGTSPAIPDQDNVYNELVLRPENPEREGYVFSGWTLGGKAFDFYHTYISGNVLDYAVDGVITLRAEWIGGSIFRVEYDAAEGSDAPTDSTLYYNSAKIVIARASTPPDGKYFWYWTVGDGNYYCPGERMTLEAMQASGNVITLWAVYGEAPPPTSITYHSNGGSGSDYTTDPVPNNTIVTILSDCDSNVNFRRGGYKFIGWNTKADGSGVSYAAGDIVRIDNLSGNDLYAQWVAGESGSLLIKKTVSGNMADQAKGFTFTVNFSCGGNYKYTGSSSGTISSGGQISLADGDAVQIWGLPAGTAYTVTESDYSGYTQTSTGASGTITAGGAPKAAFVNTKSSVPKTGDDNSWQTGLLVLIIGLAGFGLAVWIRYRNHSGAGRDGKEEK